MSNHKLKCASCGNIVDYNTICECKKRYKQLRNNKYMKQYNEKNKEEIKFFNSTRWKKLRKSILYRDGYKCMRCKVKFQKDNYTNLQVHHIKSRKNHPELRFDEDNLLTLCKTCNLQLGTTDKLDFDPLENEEIEYFL